MKLNKLGLNVCVFCDSDKDSELKPTKEDLQTAGVNIFDCENSNAIELQVFQDLPWNGVRDLVDYVIKVKVKEEP